MMIQDGFLWGVGFLGAVLVLVAIVCIVYLAVSFSSYMKERRASAKDTEGKPGSRPLP